MSLTKLQRNIVRGMSCEDARFVYHHSSVRGLIAKGILGPGVKARFNPDGASSRDWVRLTKVGREVAGVLGLIDFLRALVLA